MKSTIFKSLLGVAMLTGAAHAAPATSAEVTAPQYTNRVVALQPALSYELLGKDSLYVGFESFLTHGWRGVNDTTYVGVMEARVGRSFSIGDNSSVTPIVGASLFQDMETSTVYQICGSKSREVIYRNPAFIHAVIGAMGEYEFTKSFAMGINLKGLVGKVWGSEYKSVKELSYGFHGSLPITWRFGNGYHWDFRLEPYALMVKDYSNYAGLKSSVGYRF